MRHSGQLKLVHQQEDATNDDALAQSPGRRIFDHWVTMMGKRAGMVAFGPARRKVVERALGLYSEEVLCLAIDGCAASAWHGGDNDRGRPYNDIELILRDEAHIERFAEDGERLHQAALAQWRQDRATQAAPAEPAEDPVQVAAVRDRVRQMAQRMRGGRA
jgi:hypothetical protein